MSFLFDEIFSDYHERLHLALQNRFADYDRIAEDFENFSELDRALCERGVISENDLLELYAESMGVPLTPEDEIALPDALQGIGTEYLETHCVIPNVSVTAPGELILYVCDPYCLQHHEKVFGIFFECGVCRFELMRRTLIERMIQKVYFSKDSTSENEIKNGDEEQLRQLAAEARIVRVVNEALSQAVEQDASDIHVEPEEGSLVIRFRVDGILRDYLTLPIADYPAVASRIKLIGGLNIAESRLPQDGRTEFRLGKNDIDIRISTIPVMNGESIVMRLLRKDAMKFDLRELGMDEELLKHFRKLVRIPHGIILVVGPTGSGKTTTLYSVMQHLNDRKRKIITIEDPVEYLMRGLSQMQVNPKIDLSFSSGLRHIVRQDPDVILVGEIRDAETADIAINAALTGHLVLSTLHTNDAAGAVTRLLDMGIEPFLVSSALCGVLYQRLVRKICPVCRGQAETNGAKCRNCAGSGFRGRLGLYELLVVNDDIRQAIMMRSSASAINETAQANGMIPLLEDGMKKVRAGITTEAEVLCVAAGLQGD